MHNVKFNVHRSLTTTKQISCFKITSPTKGLADI